MAIGSTVHALTPTEIARGFLVGSEGDLPDAEDPTLTPRAALERLVLTALQRHPCGVAFSGGRDSSLVLAVAAHVARREGLPDPVPITRRFPAIEEAGESDWQELVVRHLGLHDWQRLEFDDELELIGPYAQRHLREHGVVWPAAIATNVPLLEVVPNGTLLDGEGGDDVLGFDHHRIGLASYLLRHPSAANSRALRILARELAPTPVRRRLHQRVRRFEPFAWLRPDVRRAFIDDLVRDRVERPLSFGAAVRAVRQRRILQVGERNRAVLARAYAVDRVSPLLHPEFIHAVARDGGFFGRGDRTAVIHRIAGDVLPAALVRRQSKAVFNRAYVGERSRAFASDWDGTGVDPDLVAPEGLRAAWMADAPHYMSGLLLQQAWLAAS